MKKIKIFTICLLSIVAMSVNAQTTKGWDGVRVSYNSFTLDSKWSDFDAVSGLEVSYVKSFPISKKLPLYLETGASLLWAAGDLYDHGEAEEDYLSIDKGSVNMVSLMVPVNIGYKYVIDDNFSVFPYAGAYLKLNIAGKFKQELYEINAGVVSDNESSNIDMFDKDEGDGDRFQVGLQIGTTLNYKDTYNVGISYGFDLNEVMKNVDSNKFAITFGYNF